MGTDGPPPRGADADQALLLAILSTLPARVFWKDRQSRYLGCNPAFAGDAGLASSADLVGRTDDELVWAAQARRYQADDAEVMGQGVPRIGYEEPQTTPGGGEIWLRTSKVPLRDRTGQVIGVLGMYEDITALRQARTRLERSEAALRRARDGVFWAGPDGEVQEVNRALCELLGRSAADLVGAPVAALMASMDPAAWQAQWQRLEEEGDVVLDGTLSEPHTGGPLPVELTLGLVEVDQHRVAMGLVRDLRKRRALREQLQASEARFRALMEQSPTPTRLHAPDGRCLAENDAWRTLWGAGAPCPPDDNLWEDQGLTAAGLLPALRGVLEGVPMEVGPLALPAGVQTPDREGGPRTWVRFHAWPVRGDDGSPQAIALLKEDLTGRVEAERQLAETRALHEHAQRIARLGHWRLDHRTGKLSWSDQTYRIFAQDPEDFEPTLASTLACVHPEDRERVAQAWATSLRERRNHEIEHRVITPNGEARWVHERCETRFDRAGEPVESVGTATDITARRLAEQDQEQMRQRLAATEHMESVGRLTGGIAHDFNNMLGVILGRVQLALESLPADHVARDDLREALDAANRSADLARQLLAFSRRRPAVPVRVQLNAHIPGLLRMLERLLGEGITLLWSACPRGCPVRVDPSHLDQVITNLCVNARDAMKGVGELHLSTECSYRQGPDGREQRYVTLAVRDTGCGMSPEVLARAFEPFFTTKGPGQGTGLGLATVHSIVEQAGGAVEVRSRPGEGALFRIHLPADEGPDAEEDAPGEGRAGPTGLEAPATVLVVEDEEAVMRLTCRMLQSLGYQVLSASSPNRALALLRTERPKLDLVLTDTIMPEMTGPELAEVLRREAPGLPVVFMSGYTADVLAPHGVIEEGIHFIAKPFSSAELHTTLQAVLHSAARIR